MFREAQVGDKVWCFRYGWGIITDINWDPDYPIHAKFENVRESFTYEGFISIGDKLPILFYEEIKFKIPEKKFDLKEWLKRNFDRKDFKIREDNYYLYFEYNGNDDESDEWKIDLANYYEEIGTVYLEKKTDKNSEILAKELTKKGITPKIMYKSLKEIGWL